MASVISSAFWGIVVLSLLVFIHEAGHFLAARAFGMRVTEFFLGLPSRWRLSRASRRYGTEVGVTPFLLGGYTRICGMEGEADELLAAALACVQRHGRVLVSDLAAEVGCEEDRALELMSTLVDWASVEPHYDESRGERADQSTWPAAFQTVARDDCMLTAYDREHDFSRAGSTRSGEPRPLDGPPSAFLEAERRRTYAGKGFVARVAVLIAGPLVNVAFAFVLVSATLAAFGMEVIVDGQARIWRPDALTAIRFTWDYMVTVADFALHLVMPQHTMEVLGQSSSVIGISVMASQAAAASPVDLALLAASVSMSLGFMNLLPIPPLDGGKIVVEAIQLALRRPLSQRAKSVVSYVGLAFFIFIFIFALRNDIINFVIG